MLIMNAMERSQDAMDARSLTYPYLCSPEVAGTIKTLSTLFRNTYPINQQDDSNGVPGVLYGRYQGDSYDGTCALMLHYSIVSNPVTLP